jgi:secondary thiamine-phosphate synthase enzyme
MQKLAVRTRTRTEFIDITRDVQQAVAAMGVREGRVCVFVPHTTAGVTINEHADPDVARDMGMVLDRLVPWDDPEYRHGEGNSAAHVKASLMGSSAHVLVEGGQLCLGTWQGIFLCEFDGPRTRSVWVG